MFKSKYRYLFILFLGIYSYLNIKFTEGDKIFNLEVSEVSFLILINVLVFCIWEGNRLLSRWFISDTIQSDRNYLPLVKLFSSSIIWVIILAAGSSFLIPLLIQESYTFLTFKLALGFLFRVNLFLHTLHAISYYQGRLKKSEIEAEKFKKESAEAKFDALRRQINPHFLFNSLNVLDSLIRTDATMASKFIDQLSIVYRYLLSNQHSPIIKLKDELGFINAYIYLLQIRHAENLIVNFNIEKNAMARYVAPASLQLLIENAIKHNVVSKKSPLTIDIYNNDAYIIVENNIQLKEKKESSSAIGLENIRSRYEFLGKDNPIIIHSNGKFTVKVPLLEIAEE